ncbi:hypothetical protein G6F63_014818 [Rhizopus arrhizus]|nr:hypothetical protein G6F63_014818 [Rhizopus arrhizus]
MRSALADHQQVQRAALAGVGRMVVLLDAAPTPEHEELVVERQLQARAGGVVKEPAGRGLWGRGLFGADVEAADPPLGVECPQHLDDARALLETNLAQIGVVSICTADLLADHFRFRPPAGDHLLAQASMCPS